MEIIYLFQSINRTKWKKRFTHTPRSKKEAKEEEEAKDKRKDIPKNIGNS